MMFREEMEVDVERKLLKMGGSKREKVEVSWGEEIANFVCKVL